MLTIDSNHLLEISILEGENEQQSQFENENEQIIQRKIKIKMNTSILIRKIKQNSQLQDDDRIQYFEIIKGVSEPNEKYLCYISIEEEAFYNYWTKKFTLKNKEKSYYYFDHNDQQNNNQYLNLNFHFTHKIIPFHYESNESRNKFNYLKCSSSFRLILRENNNNQYQIAIPLKFNIPTGFTKNVNDQIQLVRSLDQNIPLKITWDLNEDGTRIQLKIGYPSNIGIFEIIAALYSRIVIKESADKSDNFQFAAQAHKQLSKVQGEINSQEELILDLKFIEGRCPPLYFGQRIQSHHIVILTINFKIQNIQDLFKKNKFQIEIPVDLYPNGQINENEYDNRIEKNYDTTRFYNQYFDLIRLLKKPYKDHQTYI
ncbi:unnamed protein product [Paramecium primaurelia]|uniref:Uncharacterized protein n=1 Tax=Paramecium primaurelia TaxID=5886 RepID=A0A8S1KB67_PARPR|nr:unnamed protein product [Paramecium primaurelia]